jgi:hypothetical protein
LAWPQLQKRARQDAAQLLREVGMQVSLVTVSQPSLRTVAPPPYLQVDIKDLLKEDTRLFDGRILIDCC